MKIVSREYSAKEELLHSITHGAGALLGILGLIFLLVKLSYTDIFARLGATTYGAALILVYTSSCLFHAAPHGSILKNTLEKLDHSSIYLLILGTYIPAWVQFENMPLGNITIGLVFACALVGILLSCISVDRFSGIGFALYLVSGALVGANAPAIAREVGAGGAILLLVGALLYLVGTVFYRMRHIPYMHLLWHISVVLGSATHFVMIYAFFY